ncbi:ATP-dependent exoDNAse (exonuclease V) beta subunit (contains helicase and exonuclease domains) [Caloramator fervidus]|uniref:DNA 3'-5' helicase n=1 Tax=Caloramator fervidus TaxID=29344 RepID=A0A1H5TEZ0_9CLOT|nr:UvrD-helicase domain-containing protein [Caloramator fervidus]SEF60661.1 ATP-dependent exoDNAse (exonuclease V) beta subunit (contains helicase and exonuclease domains) [Caloramator fervidus]
MDVEKIKEIYEVNDEQALALDINKNIALHAGAGSGKTRVLTRRFLRLLLETSCDIDDIVAITFTKKAALEMKSRILELVNQFVLKSNDNLKSKLIKIKEKLDQANISTFHSFCDKIIREYYYKLELEPMYQIIEEVDSETILTKIIEDVIEEFLQDTSFEEHFDALFEQFGIEYVSKGTFNKEIKKMYRKIREKGSDINEVLSKTMDNLSKFYKNDSEKLKKIEKIEVLVANLIYKINEKYTQLKLKEGLLDFNDLEILTLKLLKEHEDVREDLIKRYKYFLVDEFQDTNDIQFEILKNLVGDIEKVHDGKLFVVGDIKQSIYSFRGTNYKVFEKVTEMIQKKGEKLTLSINFRSHDDLVKIINDMFDEVIEGYEKIKCSGKVLGLAGFEYKFFQKSKKEESNLKEKMEDIKERLRTGKIQVEDLKIFDYKDEINIASRDEEVEFIIDRINKLIQNGFDYKDIVILIRDRNDVEELERAFKKNNIPYTLVGGIGYFSKQEVLDIINMLKYFYKFNDEVALLGFLRSPFVGFSDDLIVDMFKLLREGNSFRDIAEKMSLDEFKRKILYKIEELKGLVPYYTVHKFLCKVIEDLKIKEILLSLENGIQKYRNVEKFIEIAREFDNKGIFTSFDFIEYIENLKEISSKEGEAFLDTEDSDAVKIMTIHASKGLEFEIVFVPGLDRVIKKEYKQKFIYHKEYGIVACHKLEGFEQNLFDDLKKEIEQEELNEEIRILYVALTRAIRFLGFSGYEKDEKYITYISKFKNKDLDSYVNLTKKFFDFKKDKGKCLQNEVKSVNILKRLEFKPEYITKSVVSVSRYMTYKECPKKYYFKYIAKLEEDDLIYYEDLNEDEKIKVLNGAKKGTLVHKALEDYLNKGYFHLNNEFKYIERYLENFKKIEDTYKVLNKGDKVKSEAEVSFKVLVPQSSISVFGIIDRVDIFNVDGFYNINIIDYKTNKIKDVKDIIEYYKPQFIIYYYAIKSITKNILSNLKDIKTYMYLLDIGELIEINFNEDEINYILKDLKNIFENMENKNFSDFKSIECNGNCNFKELCK